MTEQSTIDVVLDQCLEAIRAKQATISDCLNNFPAFARELEPLLEIALAIESVPDVTPSEEFRQATRARLARLARNGSRGDGRADRGGPFEPEPDPLAAGRPKRLD